jgi:hypothetical protein
MLPKLTGQFAVEEMISVTRRLHYLDVVVYPNIPPNLLTAGAVAVCILNLGIYVRRLRVRHSLG